MSHLVYKKSVDAYIDAAKQCLWQIPRENDKEFCANGGKILYAIDVDIIKLFTDPHSNSIREGNREGYAEIFEGLDDEILVALGSSLSKYIFNSLPIKSFSHFVLPPMETEIESVYTAILSKTSEHEENIQKHIEKFEKLIDAIQSLSNTDKNKATEKLVKSANELFVFIYQLDKNIDELKRFNYLLSGEFVTSLKFFLNKKKIKQKYINDILKSPSDFIERHEYNEKYKLEEKWHDLLSKERKHRRESNVVDSKVLARLEWINYHFKKLQDKSPDDFGKYRLLFITGDPTIHKITNTHKGTLSNTEKCFAEKYIRHPRSFLIEPGVISSSIEQKESYKDINSLFSFLLQQFNPGTENYYQNLTKFLENPKDAKISDAASKGRVNHFVLHWNRYLEGLSVSSIPTTLEDKLFSTKKLKSLAKFQELIANLQTELTEKTSKTWHECFQTIVSEEGFTLLNKKRRESMRSRNPPVLAFDSFQATDKFVDDVRKTPNKTSWDESLALISERDDNSGYAFCIALGIIFASEGKWFLAKTLAHRATIIAEFHSSCDEISGREAFYLKAFAIRHNARRVYDLNKELKTLVQLDEAYQHDNKRKNNTKNTIGPERFESEKLALYLAYHMFNSLLSKKIPDEIPSIPELLNLYKVFFHKIDYYYNNDKVLEYVKRRLSVNWFMTIILNIKNNKLPLTEDIAVIHKTLENIINNSDVSTSYYEQVMFELMEWFIADTKSLKRKSRDRLDKLLSESSKFQVMKYDQKRYDLIRDIIYQRQDR